MLQTDGTIIPPFPAKDHWCIENMARDRLLLVEPIHSPAVPHR
jgi:hypothetical protein